MSIMEKNLPIAESLGEGDMIRIVDEAGISKQINKDNLNNENEKIIFVIAEDDGDLIPNFTKEDFLTAIGDSQDSFTNIKNLCNIYLFNAINSSIYIFSGVFKIQNYPAYSFSSIFYNSSRVIASIINIAIINGELRISNTDKEILN